MPSGSHLPVHASEAMEVWPEETPQCVPAFVMQGLFGPLIPFAVCASCSTHNVCNPKQKTTARLNYLRAPLDSVCVCVFVFVCVVFVL